MNAKELIAWVILLSSFSIDCRAETDLLFSSTDAPKLSLTLKGPWSKIAHDSSKEPESSNAVLSIPGLQGLDIKVKPRGKSRRRRNFCRFPPLLLDLPKNKLASTPFAGQNKLKLVTHCARLGPNSGRVNDRLWSEYLAYRIYNLVTDASFRVQAVDIRYEDLNGQEVGRHPGFLIEHKKSVAKRLQLTPITAPRISKASLASEPSALVALFQYLIGGTDYSQILGPEDSKCCHNLTSMAAADGRVTGVPYDFDATGFVDPPYGGPLPHLRINSYTQRLYRGFCSYKQGHQQALETLLATKPEIERLVETYAEISSSRRKKLLRFIKGFYKRLPDQPKGLAWLDKECR